MPEPNAAELQKEIDRLKKENDALKAAAPVTSVDVSGLEENKNALLKEKKKLQKELETLKAAQEKREKEDLQASEQYKELAERLQAEIDTAKAENSKLLKRQKFQAAAVQHNLAPQYMDFVMSQDGLEFDEAGELQNSETFFTSLKETTPAFFQSNGQNQVVTDSDKTNVSNTATKPYTLAQLGKMSHEERMKIEPEVKRQEALGLIK
jgi:chromosome segregation ATPase